MPNFNGFTSKETFTQIPDSFLQMLNEMDDIAELKVTLFALRQIERMEGNFRALKEEDFEPAALGLTPPQIQAGVQKALQRRTLLTSSHKNASLYFLNSPRGRMAAEAFAKGTWQGSPAPALAVKSNLFKLYEENIGALTPLLADMLLEAEREYPAAWFEEAFEIAVSRNVRNWKYIEAILKRRKETEKDERKDNQDAAKDSKRYSDSEFSEFINRD